MAETQIEVPPLLPAPSAALLAEIEGGAAAGCVLRKLPGFGTKGQKGPRVQVAPVGAGYRRLQSHAAFGAPKSGAAAKAGGGADKAAKSKKDKKQKKKKKSGSQGSGSDSDVVVDGKENHYAALGLEEQGCDATDEEIKSAYRRLIVIHHPDKQAGEKGMVGRTGRAKGSGETDPRFLAIKKAYETLSDESRRRAYDSQFDFDDSIPSANKTCRTDQEFYDTFGPVFRRNARFSVAKPVPMLGDNSTPLEQVSSFYSFWLKFDSWRDFSQLDEHDTTEADGRDERRWMEKQNRAKKAKRKAREVKRLANLVERAYKIDPRIRRQKAAEREEKERAQAEKAAARKAASEAAAAEAAASEAAAAKAEADEKAAAKQAKILAKATRRRLRGLVATANESAAAAAAAAGAGAGAGASGAGAVVHVDNFDIAYLIKQISTEELVALCEELEATSDGPLDIVAARIKGERDAEAARTAALVAESRRRQEEIERKRAQEAVKAPWTMKELSKLADLTRKYPRGFRNRWHIISNVLNTMALGPERSADECNTQYSEVKKHGIDKAFGSQSSSFEQFKDTLAPKKAAVDAALPTPIEAGADPVAAAQAAAVAKAAKKEKKSKKEKKAKKDKKSKKSKKASSPTPAPASAPAPAPAAAAEGAAAAAEPAAATGASAGAGGAGADDDEGWSPPQQTALEVAMKDHPSSLPTKERWKAIAGDVPGKSMKECVARFKTLRKRLLAARTGKQ